VLPSVIYDNIYVHLAATPTALQMRKSAMERKIPLFNPIMPGKWKLDRWLRKSRLAHYLPETHLLQGTTDDVKTIRRFRTAYIKPVGGYGGMGVSRVQTLASNRFRASVDRAQNASKPIRQELSEHQLRTWLKKRVQQPHLLQKGLDLMTIQDRRVDFRVVVHRDGQGQWKLVGIVPKVAARDGVVTNLVAGGERMTLGQLQHQANLEGKAVPVERMTQCALEIATFIQKRCPSAALIGFDLGVEQDGNVAMIEMNPKPARSLLSTGMTKTSAKYAVDYAIYLATRQN
jgi:glutathione synthase/RimK-type ligase-like ATP-grasp enzyme